MKREEEKRESIPTPPPNDVILWNIYPYLANGVMSTSVVVRGILLPTNDLLRMVELTVGTTTDLITNRGFQIDVNGTWDVLPSTRLTEEGIEGIIPPSYGLVGGHLSIGLNAMLEL
jgi:hypothetical protein